MLWQSSLLIAVVFALDIALRRNVASAVRYALWLLIPLKLLLPPSLALPSGVGWWVRASRLPTAVHGTSALAVTSKPTTPAAVPPAQASDFAAPELAIISLKAGMVMGWGAISLILFLWMLAQWRKVARAQSESQAAPAWLNELLDRTCNALGLRQTVGLRIIDQAMSPAVFGMAHPVILIPRLLLDRLSPIQLRSALLHELIHIRRQDVWVNLGQALIQTVYWWHPLVWLANARIRLAREEAVDDTAMVVLQDDADSYLATLVQVGSLVMRRTLASLGMVGILESRSTLGHRIKRLINFQAPSQPRVTVASALCLLAFAAVALPMGQAPATPGHPTVVNQTAENPWPDPRFPGYAEIKLEPRFFILDEAGLRSVMPELADTTVPIVLASNQVEELDRRLRATNTRPPAGNELMSFAKFSGGTFSWRVGGCTNNQVNYLTRDVAGRTIVFGADSQFVATNSEWIPLELTVVPWSAEGGTRCEIKLTTAANSSLIQPAEVSISPGGAIVCAILVEPSDRKYEVVLLQEGTVEPKPATPLKQLRKTIGSPELKENQTPVPGDLSTAGEFNTNWAANDLSGPPKPADQAGNLVARENGPPLYTRIMKVDPAPFQQGVRQALGRENDARVGPKELQEYAANLGWDFQPPKEIIFDDAEGTLLLRGTLPELGLLEGAISVLNSNSAPAEIRIRAQFIELPLREAAAFWQEFAPADSPTEKPSKVCLDAAQMNRQTAHWRSVPGAREINELSVTTLTGRQTEMESVDFRSVVTAYTNSTSAANKSQPFLLQTTNIATGPGAKITAYVSADGTVVQLNVSAWMTEFLGYDDPRRYVRGAYRPKPSNGLLPLPHFRIRTWPGNAAMSSVVLSEGKTAVLGGFKSEDVINQIPFFDRYRPIAGTNSRLKPVSKPEKEVILLLTPTIQKQ